MLSVRILGDLESPSGEISAGVVRLVGRDKGLLLIVYSDMTDIREGSLRAKERFEVGG
jgi:hypothetical protein